MEKDKQNDDDDYARLFSVPVILSSPEAGRLRKY